MRKKVKAPRDINILVMEDTPSIMAVMVSDLKKIGFTGKIYETEGLVSAIKMCNKVADIDLIISDWFVPDGTGLDFLKKLKATKRFKSIPFLMCTTVDEISNILMAVKEGASEYLTKPWEVDTLEEKIDYCWAKALNPVDTSNSKLKK